MKLNRPRSSLSALRHWPSWILCGLLRLVVLLPYPVIVWLGRWLGGILRILVPYRRKIAEINLALCFPDLGPAESQALVKRNFQAIGISMLEMALCWWASDKKVAPLSHITGLDNLRGALEKGTGVILLAGHVTSFEIAGRLLVQHIPMCVTYREFRNPVFHRFMEQARRHRFEQAIHRYDIRALIQALRDNNIVWYAPDQDPGIKHSIFAPFFGMPAATLTTTSRLARITGAKVVPFRVVRLATNRGYELNIDPPLTGFPSEDLQTDASAINALLEKQIRTAPEQYYWVHRRFKTRPPGEAGFYSQKPRRIKRQQQKGS